MSTIRHRQPASVSRAVRDRRRARLRQRASRRRPAPPYQGGDDALVAPQYRGFLKKSVKELPTPALLIDLDIFERNLQALASYMKGRPVTFRPHGKAHKSPAIGKLQLASGAQGFVRRQARRSRRADPRRHQRRPDHRRSRRAAQDRAPDGAARHHPRREGGRRQRAERRSICPRRRWHRRASRES